MVANCIALVEHFDLDLNDLFDISFHKKKEVAFRAAWMLEYIMTHNPAVFVPHVPRLLQLLPAQKNPSAMRHYTKIIALLTDRKADPLFQQFSKEEDFEGTIEVLFTWLVDPEMLVATKVHCMQALANLAHRYDWIKDDLLATIDYLADIESIAFFARSKQVRKQLKKIT